jgi:hypothetical protein
MVKSCFFSVLYLHIHVSWTCFVCCSQSLDLWCLYCNLVFGRLSPCYALWYCCLAWFILAGVIYTDSVDRTPELALRPRIPCTERQNSRCVHGFRAPNARTRVASTDSVHRTPELSLRSRIPWTERQNSRCVHGIERQNSRCVHGLLWSQHFCELLGSFRIAFKLCFSRSFWRFYPRLCKEKGMTSVKEPLFSPVWNFLIIIIMSMTVSFIALFLGHSLLTALPLWVTIISLLGS